MKRTIQAALIVCLLAGLCACGLSHADPVAATDTMTESPTQVPTEVSTELHTEASDLLFSINQAYTEIDNYLKDVWEQQQASGSSAVECSVVVPVLKKTVFRFDSIKDYDDRITYTFQSVHASVAGQTVRVCLSLRPNTFEEFTDNYASWTEDGAVYCWNENMNIWAFDIEDDIDGNFLYVEFPVSEDPTPLSAVRELFDFELRTYSPESNAEQ